MRQISISSLIDKSVGRTRLILFEPFRLKKWLVLLFIAALAGQLGGGGGGGNPATPAKKNHTQTTTAAAKTFVGNAQSEDELAAPAKPAPAETAREKFDTAFQKGGAVAGFVLLLFLIAAFFAVFVFFVWLGSRFEFIWLHALIKNDASVRAPFGTYRLQGNSNFVWGILIGLAFVVIIGITLALGAIAPAAGGAFRPDFKWTPVLALKFFTLPGFFVLAELVFFGVVMVFINDFVLPIMMIDNCTLPQGWRAFREVLAQNQRDLTLYIFVKIALWILTGIIGLIAVIALLIAMVLVGLVLFGVPFLIFNALKLKIVFWIYAVIAGVPAAVAALLLLMSVNLPLAVFRRCFSLYYFTSLKTKYALLPLA